MDIKRKQHILPESYLKHWVDAATTVANKTPMVWTFSKDAKLKDPKPPASGKFWRDYFYDLISTGDERRQDLENLLAKIEHRMRDIVHQRILHKQPLNHIEKEELDLFVAFMFLRTERMKDMASSAASALGRIEKAYAQAHEMPIPDTSVMEHNAHVFSIYHGVLFMSEALKCMSHNVFFAPAGKAYLTSDTPCIWQAPFGVQGLVNPMLEITLPLTPSHLLHISNSIPTSGYIEATDFLVDQTNWEAIRQCRSYFVSNSPDLDPSWLESEEKQLERLLRGAERLG